MIIAVFCRHNHNSSEIQLERGQFLLDAGWVINKFYFYDGTNFKLKLKMF